MAEILRDLARSELTVEIDTDDLTLVISNTAPWSADRFSTTGDCTLALFDPNDDTLVELVRMDSRSGNTITLSARGAGTPVTTARSWPIGTRVEQVLDRAGIVNYIAENGASRPGGIVFNGTTNPNGEGVNITPNLAAATAMSSNTNPSPFVASASSNFGGYEPFKAFDNIGANTYWLTNTGSAVPSWLQIDLGSNAVIVETYRIMVNDIPEPSRAPRAWTLRGSNDGTSWTTIDTVTGQTAWTSGQERTYICDVQSVAYRMYRLEFTENNGDADYTQVARFYLIGPSSPFSGGQIIGDWFINTANKKMYGPYDGSTWPFFTDL